MARGRSTSASQLPNRGTEDLDSVDCRDVICGRG
jgi:hypothetical protein